VPTPYVPQPDPEVRTATCRSIVELDDVFGRRGAAAHCWCQFDRMTNTQLHTLADDELRERLATELRRAGPAPGVVATLDGQPVGWCSVAPRSRFPRLATSASTVTPQTAGDDPDVWSVTCFVVRPGYRRRGVARALLDGAVAQARAGGAGWLEGYPVDTRGRQASAADLYRGTLSLFTAAGFEVVARPRPGRAIVRLEL
jgi:ribosomal protein S18 acetylase RimI-like enzyme